MNSYRNKASFLSSTESPNSNNKGSAVSNNNQEWDLGNDVFVCCYEQPMGETMQPGMHSVQAGLDRHQIGRASCRERV